MRSSYRNSQRDGSRTSSRTLPRDQSQEGAYGYVPSYAPYVPSYAEQERQSRQAARQAYPAQSPSVAPVDRRGSITSVFALLLSLVIVALAVGGTVVPQAMAARYGTSDLMSTAMCVLMGYGAILLSFVLETPTILLALRAVSNPRGHVGRGRGLVSIVVGAVAPVAALSLLTVFVVGQAQEIKVDDVIPRITTNADGKMQIVGGEGLGGGMVDVINQVNEMSEEGYSIGFDDNGNVVATDPNGQTVTIDADKLSELGAAM